MTKSEQTNELFAALAKAQAEIKPAKKSGFNPHYKSHYSTLSDVWNACRAPLSKNGLCVIQTFEQVDNKPVIRTVLGHSSGQFVSGECPIISSKQDMQGLGSAISYAKRYSLSAVVGVDSDEDDDGEAAAQGSNDGKQSEGNQSPASKSGGISEAQRKRLYAISKKANWSQDQVKEYMKRAFNIESSTELDWKAYDVLCKTIERQTFADAMK